MKGSQESLTTAVVKDAANWPTPNAQVSQDGESPETWLKRKEAMKAIREAEWFGDPAPEVRFSPHTVSAKWL